MADLLRSGNTMLNMACPVCNNPIFRNKNGNTFCPTCNRDVLIVNNSSYQDKTTKNGKIYHKEQEYKHYTKQNELLHSLKDTLFEKIEMISKKLKKETHLQLIESYTNILLNAFEILHKISFLREK